MDTKFSLNSADVRRRFDQASTTFDSADFVHAVTRDGLFARLDGLVVDAGLVVDLGCATGAATRQLSKRFRGARILSIDLSGGMLERCSTRRAWFTKASYLQADARAIPLADQSVDVVFSNLLLPWIDNPGVVAAEVSRILRQGGLFIFSTLGPDSLLELRQAWADVSEHEHVNRFLDMHDVGDALVQSGLRDPVLDVDRLSVTYSDANALFRDLSAVGARNSLACRQHSLSGRIAFERMRRQLESNAGASKIRFDLELIYAHCWGSGAQPGDGHIRIDATTIPHRHS
ncbi:MAG: methyltransferase domain-containing protein [Gammaproteobacteria bacterium]|nr:methyltransferase domain-containing protein [Gammaproteobacteria bacterium]